ncbi:MAG: hypothetical protein KJN67_02385 [Pontiella sp.]|nr:hypothetical protein [Pontiella sp.]
MTPLQNMDPMTWIILICGFVICVAALVSKAIRLALKLAVIVVMVIYMAYFLTEAGIINRF